MTRKRAQLTNEEIVDNVLEARRLLQEVYVRSDTPSFVHAAYQADVHCHALLWELGEERGTTPELEELVSETDAR